MSRALRLLVLGDSALSSLGAVYRNALDYWSEEWAYEHDLQLWNASAAGMTAADAWVNFVEQSRTASFDGVVLYVGNCDACSFGTLKFRGSHPFHGWRSRLGNLWYRRRHSLWRRNLPGTFVHHDMRQGVLRRCVTPSDYQWFIDRIVRRATRRNMQVFLVLPESKKDFPPCNNTGNFLFYEMVGIRDARPFPAVAGAEGLAEAAQLQEAGRVDAALSLYQELAAVPPRQEHGWIARNNAAVLLGHRGDLSGADRLLADIPTHSNPMAAMALFNRALIARKQHDEVGAQSLFRLAREADTGTYRITEPYGAAVAALQHPQESVHLIDLRGLIQDDEFLDYCHPTEPGHRKIAAKLAATVEVAFDLAAGGRRPRIDYLPLNPDRASGHRQSFFDHFGIRERPRPGFCEQILAAANVISYPEVLQQNESLLSSPGQRAPTRILVHPLCGTVEFLRALPPTDRIDQGQLPELYFLRCLMPLYRGWSQQARLRHHLGRCVELLPRAARLHVWWSKLESSMPPVELSFLERLAADLDAPTVLSRMGSALQFLLARQPLHFTRYRTMTYWYLRESLVFGSTSHHSMFFDRMALLHVVSSGLYLLWFAGSHRRTAEKCAALMQVVDSLLEIHARFLRPFQDRLYEFPEKQQAEYRSELASLSKHPLLLDLCAEAPWMRARP